jgi:hypothetical protein
MNLNLIKILKTYPRHSGGNYGGNATQGSTPTYLPNDEGYASSPGSPNFIQFDGTPWVNAWHKHIDGSYAKGFASDHFAGDEFQDYTRLTIAPPPPANDQSGNTVGSTTGAVTVGGKQSAAPATISLPDGVQTNPSTGDSNVPSDGSPPPDPPPPPIPDLDSDLVVEYNAKGVLWKSTDPLVGRRDPAGNLIYFSSGSDKVTIYPDPAGIARNLQDGSILIEGIMENIDRQSYMETIKTSFEYFKFPATTKVNEFITIPELDEVTLDLETADERMFIRLKPSENWPIRNGDTDSSVSRVINSQFGYTFDEISVRNLASGTLMDELIDGDLQYQSGNTGIQITPEFKESGANLRIQIKITHAYNPGTTKDDNAWFTLIKFSPGGVYRNFRPMYERKHGAMTDSLLVPPKTNTTYNGTVNQYTGALANATAANSLFDKYSIIGAEKQKHLFAEFVLNNSEFQAHDRFAIGAVAGGAGHTVQSATSYMIAMDASRTETPDGQDISLWRQMGNKFYSGTGVIIG